MTLLKLDETTANPVPNNVIFLSLDAHKSVQSLRDCDCPSHLNITVVQFILLGSLCLPSLKIYIWFQPLYIKKVLYTKHKAVLFDLGCIAC